MNDKDRRLRAVERRFLTLPAGEEGNVLQTLEDGTPLGDTRFLDFGAGVTATLVGDDYVLVEGSAAGAGPWDAIVDASAAATDTSVTPPIFKTSPGEALAHLNSIGLTRANVFVRPGTYNEAANVTGPASVLLFGAPGGDENLIQWVFGADIAVSGVTGWNLHNITVSHIANTTTTTPYGAPSRFFAFNCEFNFNTLQNITIGNVSSEGASWCYFNNCSFIGMKQLGSVVWIKDCDMGMITGATPAAHYLFIDGFSFAGSPNITITLPRVTVAKLGSRGATSANRSGFGSAGILTLSHPSGTQATVTVHSAGANSIQVSLGGSNYSKIELVGNFTSIAANVTGGGKRIEGSVNAGGGVGLDVLGPATLDVYAPSTRVNLRGNQIGGHIVGAGPGAGTQFFVNFIACSDSKVDVSAAGTAATEGPYNFDASSNRNILNFAGASPYPVAGVDLGTGNLITTT